MSQIFEGSSILKIQVLRIAGERQLVVRVKLQGARLEQWSLGAWSLKAPW